MAEVLFICKDTNVSTYISEMLDSSGYKVSNLYGYGNAISQTLSQKRFSVVLAHLTESDQLHELKIVWKRFEMPLLLISNNFDKMYVDKILDCEPYGIIREPVEINELLATIKSTQYRAEMDREQNKINLAILNQSKKLASSNNELQSKLDTRISEVNQIVDMYYLALQEQKQNTEDVLKILSSIVELRENSNTGHSQRVAEHAKELAESAGLSHQLIEDVYYGSLLHDIGMMGFPDELISIPYEKLSLQQSKKLEKHCHIGEQIVSNLKGYEGVSIVIRSHHERYNGKGYPDGLDAENIPITARIVSVVQEHDDYINGMVNGTKYDFQAGIDFLKKYSGSRYDPDIVKAYITILEEKQASSNECGVEIALNDLRPEQIIAADVISNDGFILIAAGQVLTERLIIRIKKFVKETDENIIFFVQQENLS